MALEHLGERIERAMREARFRNVWGQSFDVSVMHELYARKRHHEYRVTGAESISVGEGELAVLVAAIAPMLAPYRASNTGPVGNGLYRLTGESASPRLPSVEDYARILVLASARIGPERVAAMFGGWIEGQSIQTWQCFLLKGVINEGRLSPREGLALPCTHK